MTSPPPPAPEVRGRLRAVWDRLSRRQLLDAGELLAPLPAAEPAVRNARAVWHLGMRETDAALELLRPLALLPDEISLDPGADIAWRANFVLALLKAGNADGFSSHLDHLKDSTHPGITAMRKLAEEAGKSRGLFSRMFGSAPMPEMPSEFPVGWPEDWLAAEPSPPREIPAHASPVGATHLPASPSKPVPPASRPVSMLAVDLTGPLSRREIRVFISSTFRDMQADRELLVKNVFPELRRICDERFVSFTEVDLRWGITEGEAAEGKVLPICLEEIHTCRPYFIGILGERYGWIPDTVPQEVLDKEPWIQEHIGHRTSVTELEILHGVLNNPKMDDHAFFYFRDPAYSTDRGEDFLTENPDSAAKLAALKETIRKSKRPLVDPYKEPKDLADAVQQQFIELIDQLYPKEQVPDPLDQEAIGHRSYAHRKLLAYVDRPSHSQALSGFLATPSTGQGLVVTGDSGSGKTALLAAFATLSFNLLPSTFLFEHYFGATPDSASVDGFLRRLLGELKRLADIKDEMPSTSEKMREALPLWLAQTRSDEPIVLVLDALNQIQGDEADRHLNWLPRFFPAHIRVVASCLPSPALDTLRERGWAEHLLPLADTAERGRMIDSFLEIYSRKLGDKLRGQIINATGTANPLFLRTVLEELRQFGSFEELPKQVAGYLKATTPQDLFRQVIQRWQHDFHAGRDIVSRSLRHLWAARQGLSENEWLDLLADKQGEMDRQTWRPLLLAMEPHLVQRGSLWAFGHNFLRQAVESELVPTDDDKKHSHVMLADYFENQPGTPRSCTELPYQLKHGLLLDRLRACILDIDRFLLIFNRNKEELRAYWVEDLFEEQTMGKAYLVSFGSWSEFSLRDQSDIAYAAGQLGVFLWMASLHADAETLYRRAIAIADKSFGRNHHQTATLLNNLAALLNDSGRLEEAEPLYRRALAIDEQTSGENHQAVARDLANLASLLQDINRLDEAEPLCRRALAIAEEGLGRNHPDVASHLGTLALLLLTTNNLDEAEPLFRRALAISEKSLSRNHPDVARAINNLARFLYAINEFDEAEPLMRRALTIADKNFGRDHPDVATCLNNLAQLLQATNRLAEAEPLMRRALAIDEASLGMVHPLVAGNLSNLAALLQATNRFDEAELLHRRALAISEQSLGENHLMVATYLNNLATLLKITNRLDEAESLYRRALAIAEQSFGGSHPQIASQLGNLARLLEDTNRLHEAEPLYRRALTIDEQCMGRNHPDIARDVNNLATLLQTSNRFVEAEALFRRALAIDEECFGKNHQNVATRLNNLAVLLHSMNRCDEAEPLMRRMVEILLSFTQSNGFPHPHLQGVASNYAVLLESMGRSPEEIDDTMAELGGRYGMVHSEQSDQSENEPSPKLRPVLEEIMRDQSKAPDIAARLKHEDPALFMELVTFIQSQQGGSDTAEERRPNFSVQIQGL